MIALDFYQKALELTQSQQAFVVITLTNAKGHVPTDIGSKALVTESGLYWGTVGGGKVEARAILKAQELLKANDVSTCETLKWNLTTDIGMTCGGEVEYLFEKTVPLSWKIAVFGAGHVAQALSKILQHMNCQCTFIDPRPEWMAGVCDSPNIKKIIHEKPEALVSIFPGDTFFVSVTKGHASDLPVLTEIYKNFPKPKYVGAIGSEVKAKRLRADLLTAGASQEFIELFRSPIGLDIGSNDTFEIAVSIVAELLQVRDQK